MGIVFTRNVKINRYIIFSGVLRRQHQDRVIYLGPFTTHLTYNVTVGERKGFWDNLLICGRLPLFPYPHTNTINENRKARNAIL